jgi:hypothetical protein
VSIVTDAAVFNPFVFPAASATAPLLRLTMTVPSLVQVTFKLIDVPDVAEGLKEQLAVPELVKSLAAMPDTLSEKVRP